MKLSLNTWLGITQPELTSVQQNHLMHPAAANAFLAMQAGAAEQGIDCQLVSSYRSFDKQVAIWNRKWLGQATLYDANGLPLDYSTLTELEKIHAILTWSALPGGSRHHWGTDIDVYDKTSVKQQDWQFELVDEEYQPGGPCYRLHQWLETHSAQFGFTKPFTDYHGGVAEEKWHLSHNTSAQFESQRNIDELYAAIEKANMEGKAQVLAILPELFERYVLNQGVKKWD